MSFGTVHQKKMMIIIIKKYALGLRNEVEYGVIFTYQISIQICEDSNLTPKKKTKHWNINDGFVFM